MPTHRECIDWIVAWDREDADSIGHDNVPSLPDDAKACFLQRPHSSQMINSGNLGHDLARYHNFAHFLPLN